MLSNLPTGGRLTLDAIRPSFAVGVLYSTPTARGVLLLYGVDPADLLQRHANGDFGIVSLANRDANDQHVGRCSGLVASVFVVGFRELAHVLTNLDAGETCICTNYDLMSREPKQ